MAIDKFLALSPIEKRTRLKDRMKKWQFKESENPEERSFRDYWRHLKTTTTKADTALTEHLPCRAFG